jgi:hypothetical protein
MFLVLGIEFYQQVNGEFYPLNSGSSNILSIVAIEQSEAEEEVDNVTTGD